MYFKFVLLFASLFVISLADIIGNIERLPLTVLKVRNKNEILRSVNNGNSFNIDAALLINITIGSGKDIKLFTVQLDSTTNMLWVPSGTCYSCNNKETNFTCPANNSTKPVATDYIEGNKCIEQVSLGSSHEAKTGVVSANYVSAKLRKNMPRLAGGSLGLINGELFKALLRPEVSVSLYINPKDKSKSSFYLGVPSGLTDKNLTISAPRYIRSLSDSEWKISLDYISNTMGEWKQWNVMGSHAIVDTKYSGISGPAAQINSINEYIGTDDDGYIDCYKIQYLEPLKFQLGGTGYILSPQNYIQKSDRKFDHKCKSVFEVSYSFNGRWRLGLAFLQQYLTVFQFSPNQNFISFVKLKQNH